MAPKKKSKAIKLANMSEDERLRYMQHKAIMEEEVHRRKRQIIGTYTSIKLKHEEYFSRLNSAKINQQWRHILREIKRKKLKEDISNLELYEDILNRKDQLISNLLSDFDRAEFQYSLQFQQHMDTIFNFLRVHEEKLPTLRSWYTGLLNDLRDENAESTRVMMKSIEDDFEKCEDERRTGKQEQVKTLENLESTFNDTKNDLRTKLLYKSVRVEEKYVDKVKKLQDQYDTVLEEYKFNTDSKLAHYRIISQKDDADTSEILKHYQMEDYAKCIEDKKNHLQNLRVDYLLEENNLNTRKCDLAKELQHLRQQYEEHYNIDRIQHKFLVNCSNSVFKYLNDVRKKGDQLLPLINHRSKLTKDDNQNKVTPEEYLHENSDGALTVLQKRLHKFWKTSKGVIVTNERLVKTRLRVRDDNDKLQKLLRYHVSSFRRSRSVPRNYGF